MKATPREASWTWEVSAVDDLDEIVAWARAHGPAPLLLEGWDRTSIWGWDDATGSLYAHLRRNSDDPGKPPTIRIGPDDYTVAIVLPEVLAQHIAMAIGGSPWNVITALDDIVGGHDELSAMSEDVTTDPAGTAVTMTEGHDIWWPPSKL